MMSFVILILVSGLICFSGCDLPQQKTADPNMLVTDDPEDTAVMASPEDTERSERAGAGHPQAQSCTGIGSEVFTGLFAQGRHSAGDEKIRRQRQCL